MGNNDADGDSNIEMDSGSDSDYDYSMGESDTSEIDAGNKDYLSSHLEEWTGSLLRGADAAWASRGPADERTLSLHHLRAAPPAVRSFLHGLARAVLRNYREHMATLDLLNCELELLVTRQGGLEHALFGVRGVRDYELNYRTARAFAQYVFRDAYRAAAFPFPQRITLVMAEPAAPGCEEEYRSFDAMEAGLEEYRFHNNNNNNNNNPSRLFDLSECLLRSGLRRLPLNQFFWEYIRENWDPQRRGNLEQRRILIQRVSR
ncbi:hypothetical protein ANO14919_081060 [Xylariales sp. No.14919]|nr:hypothetical protein ANO14919_081060 [Xylariales sp. No.14919]